VSLQPIILVVLAMVIVQVAV